MKDGADVNTKKTKYTDMSHHQNAGQTDNLLAENAVKFKYLGTRVTNQNHSHEEI
jgi:hypothetical protein